MSKIVINPFDADSVNDAIKKLKILNKQYQQLEKKVCFELAEIGRQVAQPIYDEWAKSWNNDPVVVEVIETETGAVLSARGDSVCFLEFGAGSWASGKTIDGFTFTPKSWSSSELGTGMLEKLGFWRWKRVKYEYIPPANAMTVALAVMRERAKEVAQRVMKEVGA